MSRHDGNESPCLHAQYKLCKIIEYKRCDENSKKKRKKKNNKKMYTTRLKICTSAKKRTTSTKINSVKTECAAMLTLDQRYDKQIL